jgi:uncharacterized protein
VGVAVVDTSAILAGLDAQDPRHVRAKSALLDADVLLTTPMIVTELDYLLPRRLGRTAQQRVWDDLADGTYAVRWWDGAMPATVRIAQSLPRAGLADASLVALAHHVGTRLLITLDRHFAQLDPSLDLLPA